MSQPPELPTKRPIIWDDVTSVEWWDGYKKIEIVDGDWWFGNEPFYRGHGSISGWIQTKVMMELWNHLEPLKVGQIYSGSLGFVLDGHRDAIQQMRLTDISFVLKENITEEKWEPYYRAPDLAVDVISDDLAGDLQRRTNDFLRYGTKQVWVVYPELKQIEVHYPDKTARTYGVDDTLDGGVLLSGFMLGVKKVFEF